MTRRYDTTPLPAEIATARPDWAASEKQQNYIADLVASRELPAAARADFERRLAAMERGDWANGISWRAIRDHEMIDRLKALPRRVQPARTPALDHVRRITDEQVPAGHYAVDNADGELCFYNVWWAPVEPGRAPYFKLYVEHGPDDTEVPFRAAVAILKKIAEDPRAAALRYGREIGACSICGTRLTNRLSRMLDIGPVCGGRFIPEDEWKARKATARDALRAAGLDPKGDVEDADNIDAIREAAGL